MDTEQAQAARYREEALRRMLRDMTAERDQLFDACRRLVADVKVLAPAFGFVMPASVKRGEDAMQRTMNSPHEPDWSEIRDWVRQGKD